MRQVRSHRNRQDAERTRADWRDNDMVFPSTIGTPTDQSRLSNCFKEVIKKAGFREIRFHDFRYTAATLMLLNGQPIIVVSRRLGHSKPSVTLDIYGHYLPGYQEKDAILLDELLTPVAVMATDWQQPGVFFGKPLRINGKCGGHSQ